MAATPPKASKDKAPSGCQLSDLFSLLGKSHMLDIIHFILEDQGRPVRFVTLQRALKLSPNTLSDRLRLLVESGLLTRTSHDEIPPRVDYAATEKTKALRPTFEQLTKWAQAHDLDALAATIKGNGKR